MEKFLGKIASFSEDSFSGDTGGIREYLEECISSLTEQYDYLYSGGYVEEMNSRLSVDTKSVLEKKEDGDVLIVKDLLDNILYRIQSRKVSRLDRGISKQNTTLLDQIASGDGMLNGEMCIREGVVIDTGVCSIDLSLWAPNHILVGSNNPIDASLAINRSFLIMPDESNGLSGHCIVVKSGLASHRGMIDLLSRGWTSYCI